MRTIGRYALCGVFLVLGAIWIASVFVGTIAGVVTMPAQITSLVEAARAFLVWLVHSPPAASYGFGFALVAIGLLTLFWHPEKGWRFYSPTKERDEGRSSSATPPTQTLVAATLPVRRYSASEKDELLDAMRSIRKALEGPANRIAQISGQAQREWESEVLAGRFDPSKALSLMLSIIPVSVDLSETLFGQDGVLARHSSYNEELASALRDSNPHRDPITVMNEGGNAFRRHLEAIQAARTAEQPYVAMRIAEVIGPARNELQLADIRFRVWIEETGQRVQSFRDSL